MLLPDAGSVFVAGFNTLRDGGRVRQQVGIAVATSDRFSHGSPPARTSILRRTRRRPRRERSQRIEDVLRDTSLAGQADTLVMKFSSACTSASGSRAPWLASRRTAARTSRPQPDSPPPLTSGALPAPWHSHNHHSARTHNFAEAVAIGDRILLLQAGELLADRPIAGRKLWRNCAPSTFVSPAK